MTRIWLVNWHFQSRITLWCRHKSTNVSMELCWQMPKFIVLCLWSIYFDHHLLLKPSIRKRRKQSCTPNTFLRESESLGIGEGGQDIKLLLLEVANNLPISPRKWVSGYPERVSRPLPTQLIGTAVKKVGAQLFVR